MNTLDYLNRSKSEIPKFVNLTFSDSDLGIIELKTPIWTKGKTQNENELVIRSSSKCPRSGAVITVEASNDWEKWKKKQMEIEGNSGWYLKGSCLAENCGQLTTAIEMMKLAIDKAIHKNMPGTVDGLLKRYIYLRNLTDRPVSNDDSEWTNLTIGVSSSLVHCHTAFTEIHLKQYDNAKLSLEKAIEIDPCNLLSRLMSASVSLLYDDPEHMIVDLKAALDIYPKSYFAYALLSIAHLRIGSYDRAYKEMLIASELNPICLEARMLLSSLSEYLFGSEVALKQFLKFELYSPNSTLFLQGKTRLLNSTKNYKGTIKSIQNSSPAENDLCLSNNYAIALWETNRKEAAIRVLEHALKNAISSNIYHSARNNLSRFYLNSGEFGKAINCAKVGVAMTEKENIKIISKYSDTIVLALNNLNRHEESLDLCLQIIDRLNIDLFPGSKAIFVIHLLLLAGYYLERIPSWIDKMLELAKSIVPRLENHELKMILINNISFVELELYRPQNVLPYIKILTSCGSSHTLATVGLYFHRIGKHDEGDTYYEKALSIELSVLQKNRIKQKRYLERAKSFASDGRFDYAIADLIRAQKVPCSKRLVYEIGASLELVRKKIASPHGLSVLRLDTKNS